uniref:Sialoadhesin-like n=1 Tax=Seriola dumerili TaxID=41447 RepID=A0A3B4UAK5_SERDU
PPPTLILPSVSLWRGVRTASPVPSVPDRVQALVGSCVVIPCSFTPLAPHPLKGRKERVDVRLRFRGGGHLFPLRSTAFNSEHRDQVSRDFQGRTSLSGRITEGDCSVKIERINECPYHCSRFVLCPVTLLYVNPHLLVSLLKIPCRLSSSDSLPKPALNPSKLEVEEGTPVRLNCSALAPCPALPPTLTWTPSIGDIEENMESKSVTSIMNFTASYLHNGQKISCTTLYSRQAGNSDLLYEKSLTLRVLCKYVSRIPMSSSFVDPAGPILEGSSVSLSCRSRANPPVSNYTWYRDGEEDDEHGPTLVLNGVDPGHSGDYHCEAKNDLGEEVSDTIQLDIQCKFIGQESTGCCVCIWLFLLPNLPLSDMVSGDFSGLHTMSLLIGSAAGALGMLLLCLPLLLFCR